MSKLSIFLATFFYIGYLPGAPGTWGSLAALIIWWFVPSYDYILQGLLILLAVFGGWIFSEKASIAMGEKDPSGIVIDEVAGMWIALFLLPKSIWLFALAFILFRFFDIRKPWLINSVQGMPGGLGIMMDDLLAGAAAWIITFSIGSLL